VKTPGFFVFKSEAIMKRLTLIPILAVCAVFLSACVSNTPPANPSLRFSKIVVDMAPYIANEGGGAQRIKAEITKQANKQFAQYKGTSTDPVLIIQIATVDLDSGFGVIRGSRGNGSDAMQGSVIVDSGGRKTIYPITAEIEADDVIEPQAIVADFLGWTEKYVFGR
jgi:hypothetical protein